MDASAPPTAQDDGLESHRFLAWVLLGGFFFIASLARGIYGAHETYFWRYERGRGLMKVVGLVAMWGLAWALGALVAFVLS